MSDLGSKPRVNVEIEYIAVKPGEVITLLVTGPDGKNVAIEVRSVGIPGSNRGHVEVLCDEEFSSLNYSGYRTMGQAVREQYGIGVQRLDPPMPAEKGGE